MSALNNSRNISGVAEFRDLRDGPLYSDGHYGAYIGPDNVSETSQHQRGDAYCNEGFTVAHQIHTLRQIAERHERQIASLSTDKHLHCDQLVSVYEQLEKVLEQFRLPSLTALEKGAALQSSLKDASIALFSSGDGTPTSTNPAASPSSAKKRTEVKLEELLCRHRDQVYDVLADFRGQIDKSERETRRRLDAVERSIAQVQGEVKQLQGLLSSAEDARRGAEQHLREEVEVLLKQQQTQREAVTKTTAEHAEKVQHCCDGLSACLARLSEETKAIKKQQQRSEKEVERQIRSIVSTEQQVAEVLERQSQNISQLETQDSLEGAFHEVKDWLGDLEKRMVSRGELLQWTDALQQEMNTLRRVMIPVTAANASTAATAGAVGAAGGNAGVESPPRPLPSSR